MAVITKFHTFSDGYIPAALITASRLNTNWDRLYTLVNGALDQENIASGYWLVASVATKPSWNATYEGKIIYSQDTQNLSVATDTQWVDLLVSVHASNHMSAGSDPIRIDELKVGTDVTTLNASTAVHGLCPRLSNDVNQFLTGLGTWVNPRIDNLTEGENNTDLDSSVSRHGLMPKLSGTATQFINGVGSWSAPTSGVFTVVADSASPRVSISNNTSRSTTATSYTKVKEIKVNEAVTGTINLHWSMITNHLGNNVYAKYYKNGVAVGSEYQCGSDETPTVVDETISGPFAENDLIQIYAYTTSASWTCSVSTMCLYYNWQLYSIDGIVLATPLEVTATTAISTTNQDPA